MTKKILINAVQRKTGVTGVLAQAVTEEIIAEMKRQLITEGKFVLPGFGTFTVKQNKARKALNPQTHKQIDVDARKTVRFRVSPAMRAEI